MDRQSGFSIMEMMVGITLGLLGMLAVTEALITFNTNRNATTQTMESQNNGTMALYLLERDLAQAGYGLMNIQDCASINWYYNSTVQTPLTTLPVSITDGGAASDSLALQYANSNTGVPTTTIGQPQAAFGDALSVSSSVGLVAGNLVVADVSGICSMYAVTQVIGPALSHASATSTYNPAVAPGAGWGLVPAGSLLANLGTDPLLGLPSHFVSKRFSVAAAGLQAGSFPTYVDGTLVDGIVFMKAQYGLDTNGDGVVDAWSSGIWPITNANANQVIALRVGIVARSPESIAESAPASLVLLPELKDAAGAMIGAQVSYTPPNRTYRHKAYSTIIPLRNVIWNN